MSEQEIEARLSSIEKSNGELKGMVKDLRDAVFVTAEIQRRQAEIQRNQAERTEEHERRTEEHERRMRHIEANLSEMTDKLNGLIGYIDNLRREPPPASG